MPGAVWGMIRVGDGGTRKRSWGADLKEWKSVAARCVWKLPWTQQMKGEANSGGWLASGKVRASQILRLSGSGYLQCLTLVLPLGR